MMHKIRVMHSLNESLLDDVSKSDINSAEKVRGSVMKQIWPDLSAEYRFMLNIVITPNSDVSSLDKLTGIVLDECLRAASVCLDDFDIQPVGYSANPEFNSRYYKNITYLDDSITHSSTFPEDLNLTANVRIQFNLPKRFQDFIRLINFIWNIRITGVMIVDTMQTYRAVRVSGGSNSYSQYVYMENIYLGYIDIDYMLRDDNFDINNYMSIYKVIESFYTSMRVKFDDVKAYVDNMRRKKLQQKNVTESLMDNIEADERRMSDMLNSQPDAAYWDERPDTHSNMYVISIFSGTEKMVWEVVGSLRNELGELAGVLLDNADVSACCSSDPESCYYIYNMPEYAVRTAFDDPFYAGLRSTSTEMHQAQVRIQFNPPRDFRRMARFMSSLYERASNIPHVFSSCSTYVTMPGNREYGMTRTNTEIVHRIFSIRPLAPVEDDEKERRYGKFLVDALTPFYHDPDDVDKPSLDVHTAEQFVLKVFRRAYEMHKKQVEEEEDE